MAKPVRPPSPQDDLVTMIPGVPECSHDWELVTTGTVAAIFDVFSCRKCHAEKIRKPAAGGGQ